MTGNPTPGHESRSQAGQPLSLDLLADLHAGLFDAETAADLHSRVASDPEASATLVALDATRRALAALPRPRMPADVAARIDAAVAKEAGTAATVPPPATAPAPSTAPPSAPVVDLSARRERRRRRGFIAGASILTAAAAAVGIIAVANLTGGTTSGDPQAEASSPATTQLTPLALSSGNFLSAVDDALGAADYGPLTSAAQLDACLSANGVDPDVRPVGAREVTFDGRPGVLIVLPAGANPPRWQLLVVGPDCGPGRPARLALDTTGG